VRRAEFDVRIRRDAPRRRDETELIATRVSPAMSALPMPAFRRFQVSGLPSAPFAPLFAMSSEALERIGARRIVADSSFGYPCRVSLVDVPAGEELVLVSYEHQPAPASPYRASGPIFVSRHAVQSDFAPGELPACVARRLMSVRAYDANDLIVDAEICEGEALPPVIERLFADPQVAYLHLHNAKRGCYACRVDRAA
jgi:hypothetical protein